MLRLTSTSAVRSPLRCTSRSTVRHHTRMLGGARRSQRRPPNYFALACSALEEAIALHQRMEPFLKEQERLEERRQWRAYYLPALRKVYGSDPPPEPAPPTRELSRKEKAQLLRDEKADIKSIFKLVRIKTKLSQDTS